MAKTREIGRLKRGMHLVSKPRQGHNTTYRRVVGVEGDNVWLTVDNGKSSPARLMPAHLVKERYVEVRM